MTILSDSSKNEFWLPHFFEKFQLLTLSISKWEKMWQIKLWTSIHRNNCFSTAAAVQDNIQTLNFQTFLLPSFFATSFLFFYFLSLSYHFILSISLSLYAHYFPPLSLSLSLSLFESLTVSHTTYLLRLGICTYTESLVLFLSFT